MAELGVVRAARFGAGVLWPLTAGHRYDLAPDIQGRAYRVQWLARARNNQRLGSNWAKDVEFARYTESLGAVAQLGERQLGMLEVTGSSPVGSIQRHDV